MEKNIKGCIFLFICLLVIYPLTTLQSEEKDKDKEKTKTETELAEELSEAGKAGGPDFGFGLGLGVAVFGDVTYQKLALAPDLAFGQFGIGLDVAIHFRFVEGAPAFRAEDWVPADGTFASGLSLYLSKIKYLRWGKKGDPLFIKFGSIDDFVVGTGFIVGNYTNTLFTPETRLFGMQFDLDGELFKFPYVGIETFVGDVSHFDVIGGRLYVRPFFALDVPILKNLQIGGTFAADTAPFRYADDPTKTAAQGLGIDPDEANMFVFGGDVIIPLVNLENIFTLATFGDIASIKGKSIGGMVGFGGKIVSIFTYGAQLRMLGDNFVPSYFDGTYDLTRTERYFLTEGALQSPSYIGWLATIGTSIAKDIFVLKFTLEGSFARVDDNDENYLNFPQLKGLFAINEGLIPGIFIDATYDKKLIKEFRDIFAPKGSLIKARLNYKTGPAVISFFYQLSYDENDWSKPEITSGLESYIKF